LVCVVSFIALGICVAKETPKDSLPEGSAASGTVNREDAIALGRTYVQAERQTIVAVNLQLTSDESVLFWPVYNAYQTALEPLRDRMVKLIVSYADKFDTLNDDDAKAMLEELLGVQEAESSLRREYLPKFEAVLPIKKVVRFYQIDNKINAEIRYRLSLEIPLLEVSSSAKSAK
jgi:hypothetical protein